MGDQYFHSSTIGYNGQINNIGMPKPVQGFLVTIGTIVLIVPMVNWRLVSLVELWIILLNVIQLFKVEQNFLNSRIQCGITILHRGPIFEDLRDHPFTSHVNDIDSLWDIFVYETNNLHPPRIRIVLVNKLTQPSVPTPSFKRIPK